MHGMADANTNPAPSDPAPQAGREPAAPLVTVRELTMDDLFDAVALACEIAPDPGALIEALMPPPPPPGPGEDATPEQVAEYAAARSEHNRNITRNASSEIMKVLPRLAGEQRAAVYGWLAGLCGMEPAAYRKLPPSALPQTIGQLRDRPEFPDFFEEFRSLLSGGRAAA